MQADSFDVSTKKSNKQYGELYIQTSSFKDGVSELHESNQNRVVFTSSGLA